MTKHKPKAAKKRNPPRREWSQDAACKGLAGFDTPKTNRERAKNRTVCLGCPVLDNCLEYALAYRDEEGFWAGLTKAERKEVRQTLPNRALSLVALESHSSFEFAPILSAQNAPVTRQLPPVLDFELNIQLV